MNQRKATSRFYGFEAVIEEMPGFAHLRRLRSISDLQLLAGIVWAAEGRGKCPLVRTRQRYKDGASYYLDGKIHLIPKHQNIGGLLHEIAHALGVNDKLAHGPAFRKRCIHLYRLYGEWNGEIAWTANKGDRK